MAATFSSEGSDSVPTMPANSSDNLYICPGETHPITRAVHLARLAAFYPNCRDCPFRGDTAQLPRQTVERLESTQKRVERKSLLTQEGVRGSYLNELGRKQAEQFATALASLLWQQTPLLGQLDESKKRNRRSGPVLVVGHDERPSSPDLVTGVVLALRRMGCSVIDISRCTEPCFRFTVDHLQAAAGIFVTGAGCEPSWTGLNFVSASAIPISRQGESHSGDWNSVAGRENSQQVSAVPLSLEQIEQRMQQPRGRPTRQAGPCRLFLAAVPYEAALWKHFHALRPLRVALACSNRLVRQTIEKIFEKIPCHLQWIEVPDRARNPVDPEDADLLRLGEAVRAQRADLGMLIDHDGSRCGFCDEEGGLVPPQSITALVAELLAAEHPGGTFAVENRSPADLSKILTEMGGRSVDAGSTQAEQSRTMHAERAIFGGGDSGRYWFGESFPTSDAILTLAKVLDVLSRSDASFSEVAGTKADAAEAKVEAV